MVCHGGSRATRHRAADCSHASEVAQHGFSRLGDQPVCVLGLFSPLLQPCHGLEQVNRSGTLGSRGKGVTSLTENFHGLAHLG